MVYQSIFSVIYHRKLALVQNLTGLADETVSLEAEFDMIYISFFSQTCPLLGFSRDK